LEESELCAWSDDAGRLKLLLSLLLILLAGLSGCHGVGDGGGNSQGDEGLGMEVRKTNKDMLCLKVADLIAGLLLVSKLVEGCRLWRAL